MFSSSIRTMFAAAAILLAPAGHAATKVNAAYGNTSILNAPIWIAKERGYFAKYGLDVELVQLTGTRITAGLMSNGVQFISSSASSPFLANIAGGDSLLVATMLNKLPYDLVVDGSKIKSFSDFKGKIGAIVLRGDISDVQLRYVLKNNGVDPEKDVNLLQGMGNDPERIAAIVTGNANFTLVQPDYRNIYESAKLTKFLNVMDQKGSDFLMSGTFTTATYAKANPDTVTSYVKAISEALVYMQNEDEGTIAIVSKYSQRPATDIRLGFKFYQSLMQRKPLVSRELVVACLETLVETSPEAAKVSPDKLLDTSFAAKLEAEGFFDKVAKEGGK